ncbi:molybdate-anion transporter-like isoform X1 [Penaeus japonicus]|uniref:molybdate-anion transporter-like isoform X1 n=2 Tax=Penaeus japonicus TaxID=27405 RepID=UPI001C710AFC|nr:molybdate-anion transporter-like isoform X1 [Penaeus japonicus]XP_042867552.1 molybdate-anion transporter-like isoform X1 [Penaeus japonicus]XP_042867553.1 molybdate-anion transporter-like isoform X1 [Penaeus japonicus]
MSEGSGNEAAADPGSLGALNSVELPALGTVTTMEAFIYGSFSLLALMALALHFLSLKTKSQVTSANNPHFKRFQYSFFLVYFMALFSDWLQGPYVYKLYEHYGYASNQIALLYVVGFASSVIFGTTTGPLADRFGRKKMALCFCIMYSFCCLTKLSSSFFWLFLGRVFGGISTSMLFSTFESWYVYEHTETHDFPSEWLSVTFSKATFWNGMLAINAGVFSNIFAETLSFGPVAPFMLAIPFLIMAGLIISQTWRENYGNQAIDLKKSCMEGLRSILFKDSILFLGVVQALFEANMYIFVFQWTPVLGPGHPPLGMVFASFMVCIMIGSSLYSMLFSKKYSAEQLLLMAVGMAIVAMSLCIYSTSSNNLYLSFLAFLILEVGVGMYFPAIGYLRSQVIPEDLRAGIMNWFRVPTNIITCAGLLLVHNNTIISSTECMFAICTFMLVIALFSNMKFISLYSNNKTLVTHTDDRTPLTKEES